MFMERNVLDSLRINLPWFGLDDTGNMALCSQAKICLLSFLSTSSLSLVYLVSTLFQSRSFIWKSSFAFIVLSTIIANALILAYLYRTRLDLYEVRVGGVLVLISHRFKRLIYCHQIL